MDEPTYNEEQIAFALSQAETGIPVEEICKNLGVSSDAFSHWTTKYGGLSLPDLRRQMALEREVSRLRKLFDRLMIVYRLGFIAVFIIGVHAVLQS